MKKLKTKCLCVSPLSRLTQLRGLYLSKNNISDVSPLSRLTQLRQLYLWSNNISDVSPLSGLTQLTELSLNTNNISDVSPLSRLIQLRQLYLESNNVSDVSPLSGLTQLRQLHLTSNPLNHAAIHTHIPALQARGVEVTFDQIVGLVPIVHVGAAERPPLYWVDTEAGTLHRLVGDEIENIAPNIRNAISIALDIDTDKIYWTTRLTGNSGKVQRANLDGTNVENVRSLQSIPKGIAIDSANQKLYWTNSRGRIQRMDLRTRKIQNLVENPNILEAIALDVAGGKVYWAEYGGNGRIRRADLNGKNVQNIATGLGEPLGTAIANNKVYWTEKIGNNAGRIQRANLNGSNRQLLRALQNVPIGLNVDTASNKLYWTNSNGRIQRSALGVNAQVENVVTDLVAPAAIVIEGTPFTAPDEMVETPAQPTQPTPTHSQYDVNQDGKVDNRDISLVSNALGQSGAAITNSRTDVNGDGQVDATDVADVIANLDDAAPGAPALANALMLTTLDVDMLREQIDLLRASGDTSFAAQRTLAYLQHLLASARPDETVLLANYPNPFNPETWIPYQLADSADVQITIYDAHGRAVRVLQLGQQPAGYYTSRSRAAYWDGRNSQGERVASGVYFYTFKAGEFTATRKMFIRK